ncbi:MAG: NAD(P)-binding domain-containing protein [Verrucomicrobia bacterium]|nr:NAD(P)-binding domain-containing protein [Verrucomicrobiota bacterium]
MNSPTIGFIGGGRITRIFLEGWARAQRTPAATIVSDPNQDALDSLKSRFPGILTTPDNAIAARQDLVFLAVHPPLIAEVASGIRDHLQPGAVLVSLAPKFTMSKLTGLLGGFARLARVIPNAPSIIGAGFNPVAFASALSGEDKKQLTGLLANLGKCPEVAEEKLEIYALFTARGPTYFWFQFYELLGFAETSGLTIDEAQCGLSAMVAGALKTMTVAGLGREEVMDLIPVKAPDELRAPVTEVFRKQLPTILEQIKP